MISIKNLKKIYKSPEKQSFLDGLFNRKYKEFIALDGISFEISDKELIGFIGPNGAGKTTTMKILSGILYPTSGQVSVLGYVPFKKNHDFLRQIGFVMGQKNQLLWDLPPIDSYKLNKEIYEIKDHDFKKNLQELTDLLEADEIIFKPVKTLSLGQRMRAELIAALLHKPKILFLDEPTIGLDIFAQTTIINFIKQYQQNFGSTVILTSHYMQDVQRLAKRVLMIDHGHIIYDGKLKELISKFSQEKTINIILDRPLKTKPRFKNILRYEYQFPQLKLTLQKDKLETVLPSLLQSLDFVDLTVENEPIEDVIKRIFTKSQ
jgi:ABC-2 type transport system ATP-binding protein